MKILLIGSDSDISHPLKNLNVEVTEVSKIQVLMRNLSDVLWINSFDAVIISENFRLDYDYSYEVLGQSLKISKGDDVFNVLTMLHPNYAEKIFGTSTLTQKYLDRNNILDINNPQACLDIINERINSINDFSNENFNN